MVLVLHPNKSVLHILSFFRPGFSILLFFDMSLFCFEAIGIFICFALAKRSIFWHKTNWFKFIHLVQEVTGIDWLRNFNIARNLINRLGHMPIIHTQCAKDCGPHNRACKYGRTWATIFGTLCSSSLENMLTLCHVIDV